MCWIGGILVVRGRPHAFGRRNAMKSLLILFILLLLGSSVGAQPGSSAQPLRLKFRLGRVVLMSGDTLDGPVALQFGPDLLFLALADGSVRTFAPASVAACAVQQEIAPRGSGDDLEPNQVRLFRALRFASNPRDRSEVVFFEQLGTGPVLLLRRQYLEQRLQAFTLPAATVGNGMFGVPVGTNSRGVSPPPAIRYTTLPVMKETFYLANSAEELQPLGTGLKAMLAAFPEQAAQLEAYAHQHRLKMGSARDLAELVEFRNSLAPAASPRP